MHNNDAPLGVFDSGVGGLTVVKSIFELLPNESVLYFGDTARLPYGTKSPPTVIRYSTQIVKFLVSQKVKAIVVACNSASSLALESLQAAFPQLPIIGVIAPGAKAALSVTKDGAIGIMGTKATISSGAYSKAIKDLRKDTLVFSQPCPLLVPLIEEKMLNHEATDIILREYLEPLLAANITKLILGCTHYPLLRDKIQQIVGPEVVVIDSASATAEAVRDTLQTLSLIASISNGQKHRFYLSDMSQPFIEIANMILKDRAINIQRLDLEEQN